MIPRPKSSRDLQIEFVGLILFLDDLPKFSLHLLSLLQAVQTLLRDHLIAVSDRYFQKMMAKTLFLLPERGPFSRCPWVSWDGTAHIYAWSWRCRRARGLPRICAPKSPPSGSRVDRHVYGRDLFGLVLDFLGDNRVDDELGLAVQVLGDVREVGSAVHAVDVDPVP